MTDDNSLDDHDEKYICVVCGERVEGWTPSRRGDTVHAGCKDEYIKEEYGGRDRMVDGGLIPCPECDADFEREDALAQHLGQWHGWSKDEAYSVCEGDAND